MKPRLLDLFCGAGGAGMGYSRAGFEVVGVDIKPQPHYPFEFHQADAFEFLAAHGQEFDVIHASPPCQRYSIMTTGRWKDRKNNHPDLINLVRQKFIEFNKPYIIENVKGAPLINPIILCGTMFNLETKNQNQLLRHRLFETSFPMFLVPPCRHNKYSPIGVYGGGQNPSRRKRNPKPDLGIDFGFHARQEVMQINWMTGLELNQAIPPAYTEFIGKQIMQIL